MAHPSRSASFIKLHALYNDVPARRIHCLADEKVSLTEAKLPIIAVMGTSPCSNPIDVAVLDPHTVAHPQVEVARVFDD
jgi:hypothetical protein